MDNAENFVVVVDNGKIGEAGFVEFIKNEWSEDFVVADENHFGFRYHEVTDVTVIEAHDGSDAVAVFGA